MPAETAAPPETPVTPRPAASLVLLRGSSQALEVLLGRRPRASRFMPGVYVFPGGAVEKGDPATARNMKVHPEVARRLEGHRREHRADHDGDLGGNPEDNLGAGDAGNPGEDHTGGHGGRGGSGNHRPSTLAWTAVRETWEETGLLVGRPGRLTPSLSHPAAEAFRKAGLVPDLESLDYIVRAITPAHLPIRFDARFFLADGARVGGDIVQNDELEDIGWYGLDSALGDMPLRGVTQFVLEEARRRRQSPQGIGRVPVLTRRNGKRIIDHG